MLEIMSQDEVVIVDVFSKRELGDEAVYVSLVPCYKRVIFHVVRTLEPCTQKIQGILYVNSA